MSDDIKNFLHQYINLSSDIVSIFEDLVVFTELEPSEFLTKIGEFPNDFFIIKSGIIRSYLLNENGTEATRAFFTAGDITGASSAMMRRMPSEVNYQALTKVTGYKGDFYKFLELTLQYHELSLFYIKTLENAYLKAENIILDVSTLSATERYLDLKKRIPNIDDLITQRNIASYLNISPVQLSRIRKKLINEKLF
ncbi:Crp/Fnr family transcriptional regulator [Tenacibaculum caenipelagi]|uniref:CRP-like cAMP-binding protein n=1 Tax=Tenacibaculum caenipelagi TaxID=1325435 RepID=A0A4R6TE27_9FLAO|nr:Crp/Fnr family transcriptional regulator [Tenacibaculum caenipelagi]TDQ27758.1 CRP-like cAMP-binding protein [Tenacibaculum caenipelagi]